ncbi:MFS transporter [Corynebacterium sp. 335C]
MNVTGITPERGAAAWPRVAAAMFAAGFGANLFAPMLEVYRSDAGISQPEVTAMLGVYALGLVPALIVGGPVSDRRGRRAVLRPAMMVSALGSVVLACAAGGVEPLLFLGRFIAGIGVGMTMAAGAAWVKELSADSPTAGPRRATFAISAGFGGGPLVSGLVAQFLPAPEVTPYLVHLLVVAVAAPLMRNAPETRHARDDASRPAADPAAGTVSAAAAGAGAPAATTPAARPPLVPRVALTRRFGWAVAAWAPWVFGTVTCGFAALPTLVAGQLRWPVAYFGLIAAVAMLSGAFIQPWAQRLLERGWLPLAVVGLGAASLGMLAAAGVAHLGGPWPAIPVACLLGCSYGVMMVAGLHEVGLIADPRELGALIGVFYALTYMGFFVPFVLSLVAPAVASAAGWSVAGGYVACFLAGAVIAAASAVPVARVARRGADHP